MPAPHSVLRQPQSWPEGRLPPDVKPLHRPAALGRAVELAFLRWEKRKLVSTARFWRDFGIHLVAQSETFLHARGCGPAPCLAWVQQGPRDRFVGTAFVMSDDTDLNRYVAELGARYLSEHLIPGGGRGVTLTDPSGFQVWLLQGQTPLAPLTQRAPVTDTTNDGKHIRRVNRMVRTPIEPAQVIKLGHLVIQTVQFEAMAQWYMRVLGVIPTDVQFVADGSPALTFMRLNLGAVPADHHALVLVGGIENKYEHSAYEVMDIDALGQGHQVLRAQGHKHMWGIGRHLLGSQLFDYWKDPEGFEHEHYTDGDVFSSDFETQYSSLDFGGIWAWGPDAPESMKPAKNLGTVWRVLQLLRTGQVTPERLKLMAQALSAPARPWL